MAFSASGVRTRHAVFDPRSEDVSDWSTSERMARYLDAVLPLARDAALEALVGHDHGDVGLLVVASCTGHVTPGLDVWLAEDLKLAVDTRRVVLGHLGCHAALPALATACDYVRANGRCALVVCAEVSSLHLQPASTPGQEAVNALFGDAAAAVLVAPDAAADLGASPRLAILGHGARSDLGASSLMTWEIGAHGFRMGLSRKVPEVLGPLVSPLVGELLDAHGIGRSEVRAWGIHPGGPRILDVVGGALELAAGELATSRAVLAEYGNCSSATVLIALQQLCRTRPAEPSAVVLVAFGPGLTCYASVLATRAR